MTDSFQTLGGGHTINYWFVLDILVCIQTDYKDKLRSLNSFMRSKHNSPCLILGGRIVSHSRLFDSKIRPDDNPWFVCTKHIIVSFVKIYLHRTRSMPIKVTWYDITECSIILYIYIPLNDVKYHLRPWHDRLTIALWKNRVVLPVFEQSMILTYQPLVNSDTVLYWFSSDPVSRHENLPNLENDALLWLMEISSFLSLSYSIQSPCSLGSNRHFWRGWPSGEESV